MTSGIGKRKEGVPETRSEYDAEEMAVRWLFYVSVSVGMA